MAALLILNYDVTDADGLAGYRARAGPVLATAGTRVVTTADTHLGEAPAAGSHTVVRRFPTRAAAEAAYRSATYQALVTQRLAATTIRFSVIVETADHDPT